MSLLDNIQGLVTPSMIGGLGRKFGIPEDKLRGSMTGVTGLFMRGLAGHAGDHSTMQRVSGLIYESPDERDNVGQLLDAPDDHPMKRRGNALLGLATGGNPAGLTGMIGPFLGIGSGASHGMLGMIAALAMTAFRTLGRTSHLDASSLGSLLHSERDTYREAIPPQLRGYMPSRLPEMSRGREVHHRKTNWGWLALALIPLAALVIWAVGRGGHHTPTHQTSMVRPGQQTQAREAPMEQPRAARPPGRAIPLDKVTFAPGSVTPEPGAETQIATLAQALQQAPDAKVTITGVADSTDATPANQQLSQARADSVRDALVAKGIDASRIHTQGGGTAPAGEGAGAAPRSVTIQISR